ncbi:MAG: phenylacetate--CoA ligase [Lachnospiraceae bacterium]
MKMTQIQLDMLKMQLKKVMKHSPFYQEKLKGFDVDGIRCKEDFEKLPFTWKGDLREAYPLGLMAVPEKEIVRIHSSSGTTGTPIIIPYTQKDVDDWAVMFARSYEMAGITNLDRIQITPGYGLWTAGIGFQNGAEKLGAMVIPMGPGNTDKQLRMMIDLKSTVLCATSSYALLLAEEIAKRGIGGQIHLKKGVIGSERWGDKMRTRIARELGVSLYDIYGLTEIYGPGIAINCDHSKAMHYWDDYIYIEILDPKTGVPVADGDIGEIVITTLVKEGAPLIRYRTHDLSRFVPGDCPCGSKHPRIDTLIGRTDDMVKVKGCNIFPSQVEDVIKEVEGASSEYQIMIDHLEGKDILTIFIEVKPEADRMETAHELAGLFKLKIGMTPLVKPVEIGELPRSEKKSTRVFDNRY